MAWKVIVAAALVASGLQAQAPPASFEIASIRPTIDDGNLDPGRPRAGGRWSAKNTRVELLLRLAYPEHRFPGEIAGGPSWISERTFDIEARAATPNPSTAEYTQMLRQLLRDRFNLKSHVERRPVDVYTLVAVRNDGRLGPRLRAASIACEAEYASGRLKPQVVPPLVVGEKPRTCMANTQETRTSRRTTGTWSFAATVSMLQLLVDRKLVDRTGLTGFFEIDFEYDPRSVSPPDGADDLGVSFFTALQEQLGLKLERGTAPLEVLVIDSVEMPSEN